MTNQFASVMANSLQWKNLERVCMVGVLHLTLQAHALPHTYDVTPHGSDLCTFGHLALGSPSGRHQQESHREVQGLPSCRMTGRHMLQPFQQLLLAVSFLYLSGGRCGNGYLIHHLASPWLFSCSHGFLCPCSCKLTLPDACLDLLVRGCPRVLVGILNKSA